MSDRCFAGIRFDFPQDGQFRMIAKVDPSIELKNQRFARISDDARKPLPVYQSARRYFGPGVAQRTS